MSLGGGIGAVIGGVLGYVLAPYTFGTSAVMGAYMGTSLGFTVGMMIDPLAADIKPPGASDQLQLPSNTIGTVIYDLLGTGKVSGGQLLFYGKEFTVEQTEKTGGKGGGGEQVTGYKYYCTWAIGMCKGPVDCLYTIFADDKLVWQGELNRSNGSEVILLQGLEKDMGPMRFHFGTDDDELVAQDLADIGEILGDVALVSPYRGLCWAFFSGCCMGDYNRMPTMSFVFRKSPVLSFNANNAIMVYDYNPIHAIWYVLCEMLGLSTDWLHSGDFSTVANQLYNDGLGISILFSQQQDALSWLESINTHVDMLLRYGSDGKFHPKLIRDDYNSATLPLIDEHMLQEEPEFTRGSWIETINEIKVQYSEIINRQT